MCGSSASPPPSFSASLPRSARRCVTPKRCCSSTIARPSRAKRTCSSITAWVPTTSAASPEATCSSIFVARLALAAAGQPGDGDAERRQPADQLLQVLLGQDLGRRHQRALPAGVDRRRRRRAPRPPSCRSRRRPAAGDASAAAAPGRRRSRRRRGAAPRVSAKRQVAQQRVVPAAADRREHRRALRLALALGLQLRQLLRQQLVELEALPGGMRAVLERLGVEPGRRLVQAAQGLAQARQVRRQRCPAAGDLVEIGARQAAGDRLAQHRLRQLHRARVDRRQRGRQAACRASRP